MYSMCNTYWKRVCVCAYCNEETTRQSSINQCNLGSRVWRTLVRIYVDYLLLWMGGSLGLVINMRLTWRRHMTSRLPVPDKAAPAISLLCAEAWKEVDSMVTFPHLRFSISLSLALLLALYLSVWSTCLAVLEVCLHGAKTCSLSRASADGELRFRASLKVVTLIHTYEYTHCLQSL